MSDPNRRPAVAEVHEGGITVRWSDKSPTHLPNYWLRDNCRCSKCRHPGNGQKLYEIVDLPADLSAIIKDEERCIRCGLCAQRCPTTAITMEQFSFSKEWKPCLV